VNPYRSFVDEHVRLQREGRALPLGGLPPAPRRTLPQGAPRALVFAPHPDDECIVGALPLRLQRQAGYHVVDVAVTLGSNKDRQAPRLAELRGACELLGFGLLTPAPRGLEGINPAARARDRGGWDAGVQVIADLLARERPRVVFCPHEADWNQTHIGVHLLVTDALARQAPGFACFVVETEFWGAMAAPNLMVESSAEDVADLVAATSFHVGEVQRNPYHLRLPAWMQDNVRRGGELVGGQGAAAPDMDFATLYRVRRFRDGALEPAHDGGRVLRAAEDPASVLPIERLAAAPARAIDRIEAVDRPREVRAGHAPERARPGS
jgi:LmbE family N-acetylglucosaminyl deacetylase